MKIVMVLKEEIVRRPPIQSLMEDLLELGHEVSLISLDSIGYNGRVEHVCLGEKVSGNKVLKYVKFRYLALNFIKEKQFDYIWFCSLDSYLPFLGSKLVENGKVILQLQELYDKFKTRLHFLKKNANMFKAIIVPEYNRAHILKVWLNLNKLPFVLPNKPNNSVIKNIKFKKSPPNSLILDNGKIKLIYQGHIDKDRSLIEISRVCYKHRNIVDFYLLGNEHNDYLSILNSINPDIIYLGWVQPPQHLLITKQMDIGIIEYSHRDLNNIFCAPNKVWEYTAFGLPVISNDLPGMSSLITQNKFGSLYNNIEDFEEVLLEMINNIELYQINTASFFDGIDRQRIINEVL